MLIWADVFSEGYPTTLATEVCLALLTAHFEDRRRSPTAGTSLIFVVDEPINKEADTVVFHAQSFFLATNGFDAWLVEGCALLGMPVECLWCEYFIAFAAVWTGERDAGARDILQDPLLAALEGTDVGALPPATHALPTEEREACAASLGPFQHVQANHAVIAAFAVLLSVQQVGFLAIGPELLPNHTSNK